MEKLLIPVNEAAAALSVSGRQVYYLISRGDLIPVKIGRRTFIRADDLRAYVNGLGNG